MTRTFGVTPTCPAPRFAVGLEHTADGRRRYLGEGRKLVLRLGDARPFSEAEAVRIADRVRSRGYWHPDIILLGYQ